MDGAERGSRPKDAGLGTHKRGKIPQGLKRAVLADDGAAVASIVRVQDLRARDENGLTLLHLAAAAGAARSVRALLTAGADANAADTAGDTPLHIAASSGHLACVRALLDDPRTEIWAVSRDGSTAAQAAEAAGQKAVLQFFRRSLKVFSGIQLQDRVIKHGVLSVCDAATEEGEPMWREGLSVVLSASPGEERLIWYAGTVAEAAGSIAAVGLQDVRDVEWEGEAVDEEGGDMGSGVGGVRRRAATVGRRIWGSLRRMVQQDEGVRHFVVRLRNGRGVAMAAAVGTEAKSWVVALRNATRDARARFSIGGALLRKRAERLRLRRKRLRDKAWEVVGRNLAHPVVGLVERRVARLRVDEEGGQGMERGWEPRFLVMGSFFLLDLEPRAVGWAVARTVLTRWFRLGKLRSYESEWNALVEGVIATKASKAGAVGRVIPICSIVDLRASEDVIAMEISSLCPQYPLARPTPAPILTPLATAHPLIVRCAPRFNVFLPELLLRLQPAPASVLVAALAARRNRSSSGSKPHSTMAARALASADALGRGKRRRNAIRQLHQLAAVLEEPEDGRLTGPDSAAMSRRNKKPKKKLGLVVDTGAGVSKQHDGLADREEEEDEEEEEEKKQQRRGRSTSKALQRLVGGKDSSSEAVPMDVMVDMWTGCILPSIPNMITLVEVVTAGKDEDPALCAAGRSFAAATGVDLSSVAPGDEHAVANANRTLLALDVRRWTDGLVSRMWQPVAAAIQIQAAARRSWGERMRLARQAAQEKQAAEAAAKSSKSSTSSPTTATTPQTDTNTNNSASIVHALHSLLSKKNPDDDEDDLDTIDALDADIVSTWVNSSTPTMELAKVLEEVAADMSRSRAYDQNEDDRQVPKLLEHCAAVLRGDGFVRRQPPPPPPRRSKPSQTTPPPSTAPPPAKKPSVVISKPEISKASASGVAELRAALAKRAAAAPVIESTTIPKKPEPTPSKTPLPEEDVKQEEEEEEEDTSSGSDEDESEVAKRIREAAERRKDPRMDPTNWSDEIKDDGTVVYVFLPTGEQCDQPPWRSNGQAAARLRNAAKRVVTQSSAIKRLVSAAKSASPKELARAHRPSRVRVATSKTSKVRAEQDSTTSKPRRVVRKK